MKRLIVLIIGLFFLATLATAGPPAPPPVGPNTDLTVQSLSAGTPAVTEGVEYKVWQKNITNDAGETIAGAYQTVEMSDETDGTEDTILRTYTLVDGTATLQQTLPTP